MIRRNISKVLNLLEEPFKRADAARSTAGAIGTMTHAAMQEDWKRAIAPYGEAIDLLLRYDGEISQFKADAVRLSEQLQKMADLNVCGPVVQHAAACLLSAVVLELEIERDALAYSLRAEIKSTGCDLALEEKMRGVL